MSSIRWSLLLLLVGSMLLGAVPAPTTSAPLRWYTFEEVARIKAANPEDTKAVFVDVYTDWCGWCKRMDATTFKQDDVKTVLRDQFYPVKFDAEQREAIEVNGETYSYVAEGRRGYHELAATLLQGRMSYPTVVFLDDKMNMIQPLPGYRTAKEILPILHFIGDKAYQNQSWEAFSQEWQAKNK